MSGDQIIDPKTLSITHWFFKQSGYKTIVNRTLVIHIFVALALSFGVQDLSNVRTAAVIVLAACLITTSMIYIDCAKRLETTEIRSVYTAPNTWQPAHIVNSLILAASLCFLAMLVWIGVDYERGGDISLSTFVVYYLTSLAAFESWFAFSMHRYMTIMTRNVQDTVQDQE